LSVLPVRLGLGWVGWVVCLVLRVMVGRVGMR
jgi:hypothetical protein